jgi:tRNA-specific 2-thiouridylase
MERRQKFAGLFLKSKNGDNGGNSYENGFSNATIEVIQQRLVEKGLAFKQSSLEEEPTMTRVPGCVATVYVVAKPEHNSLNAAKELSNRISLYGNADAIVSRGLLSLLKDYLQQLTADQILQLEPMDVADVLGVRPALSKGRNDGLANMLTIIQNQLKGKGNGDIDTVEKTSTPTASSTPSIGNKKTVALLLSGGVDSSVAFRLLLEQGYDVTPFYLKIWLEDELAHLGECPWEDDVNTCRQVCDQVGVDLEIISLQKEYHQRVMQHTLNEASLGRTPNPDILCNSRVKFGCFLEYLNGLPNQFDYIASGHYAQVKRTTNNIDGHDINGAGDEPTSFARLIRAPDPVKDQSYFLCALNQSQLSRLLFPIGHLEKTEVRQLADDFELPNRHRPDSQGLCFLGKVKFRDFMQIHLGEKVGDLVDAVTGEIIGQHHGVWYHTVGQRKGIGPYLLPKATAKGPWYVVAKDPSNNIVYASNKYDEDVFVQARSEFHVENLHWISGREPTHLLEETNEGMYRFIFKIRHGPKLATGTLQMLEDEEEGTNEAENTTTRSGGIIKLDQKDGGLAPGQYVVFYTEDAECLGGGIISERHWAKFLLDTQSRSKAAAEQ